MSSSTDASPPAVPYEPYNDDLHFMEFPREEGDLSSNLDGRTTWDAGVTCVGSFKEDARALVDGDVPEGPIDSATMDQTYHQGHGVCAFCRLVFAQPVVNAKGKVVDAELFAIYIRRGIGSRPEVIPNALQTPFLKILDWRYVQFEIRLLDRVQGEYNLNTPLARIRAKIVKQLQEMKQAMED
jgi:hypothetical protein